MAAGGWMEARLRMLVQMLVEKDLQEIEVSFWGVRFRVVRDKPDGGGVVMSMPTSPSVQTGKEIPRQDSSVAEPPSDTASEAAPDDVRHPGIVPSPMVGVVYLAPEPGAEPFISEGDKVKEGQTLMIIEAMKTMNMIPAPRAGTLLRLLVENGQAVEYGEPLLIIE